MRLSHFERAVICAGLFVGLVASGPMAFAQEVIPAAPGGLEARKGTQDRKTPRAPKEPGAKIRGRFVKDVVLDETTDKVRKNAAGPCDSVTSAEDLGADRVALVCNKGKHGYFMQRTASGWAYAAPPLIVPQGAPKGR